MTQLRAPARQAPIPTGRKRRVQLRKTARRLGIAISVGILALAGACGEDEESARGDVVCNGLECQCPGSGDCEVTRCDDLRSCPDGVQVCQGTCPED